MATVASAFAELERDLISERTREALSIKKEQGVRIEGVRALMAEIFDGPPEFTDLLVETETVP